MENQYKALLKRVDNIDFAKSIGVICIVLHHSCVPNGFIYPFEVAMFMVISGFLYNDNHSESFRSFLKYVIKKIKTLYFPLVFWNCILVLLNNFFLDIGIYTDDKSVFLINATYELNQRLDFKSTVFQLFKIITLQDTMPLSGGSWFLRALFVVTIVYSLFSFITLKIKKTNRFNVLIGLTAFVLLMIVDKLLFPMPKKVITMAEYYVLYSTGFFLKNVIHRFKDSKFGLIAILVSIAVIVLYGVTRHTGFDIYVYSIIEAASGVAALIICYKICDLVVIRKGRVYMFFLEIGKNSLSIIILHCIAFKITAFIQLLIYGYPKSFIAAWPFYGANIFWILFNVIIGILVPFVFSVGIHRLYDITKLNFLKYIV